MDLLYSLVSLPIQRQVLALGFAAIIFHFALKYFVYRFRKNLHEDQIVGVRRREDDVINCKILRVSRGDSKLVVLDLKTKETFFTDRSNVFLSSKFS